MEQATLRASPRRLREARRQGMVPVSRELLALASVAGAAGALYLTWPALSARLMATMSGWMILAAGTGPTPWEALTAALSTLALALAPTLAAATIGAAAAGLAQTRAMVSLAPLSPRLSRVSHSRRPAGQRAYTLGVGMARAAGGLLIIGHTLWQHSAPLVGAAGQPIPAVLAAVGYCLLDLTLRVGLLLLALALLDLLFQRWAHGRRLRMTRRQVRMERREAEGDPGHRAHRQRLHHELSAGQDLSAAAEADCVITAGLELSAALRYDAQTMDAPRLLVCGAGKSAAAIRDAAHANGRPVVHRPGLARALASVEPGGEVPRRLWEAVAEVWRAVKKGER